MLWGGNDMQRPLLFVHIQLTLSIVLVIFTLEFLFLHLLPLADNQRLHIKIYYYARKFK